MAETTTQRTISDHGNDIGDWCPWSKVNVVDHHGDDRCPAGCAASRIQHEESIEFIDARDGNACSVCGNDFGPDDATVPYGARDGWQQHAHVGGCPTGGDFDA